MDITYRKGKDVDLLFGLDMLKRYKAKIDLEKNVLAFAGIEVPFLAEHEIPKYLEDALVDEPTVPGPNGTEIGAQTGAVRPAGTTASAKAAATAGPAPAEPSTAPQPDSGEGFPPADIEQLTNLGFSRQAAIQALQATGGNVEYAAGLLLENV
jgi:DNA damage-inducible protein 1